MGHLHVEHLESRRLLNGYRFMPGPVPAYQPPPPPAYQPVYTGGMTPGAVDYGTISLHDHRDGGGGVFAGSTLGGTGAWGPLTPPNQGGAPGAWLPWHQDSGTGALSPNVGLAMALAGTPGTADPAAAVNAAPPTGEPGAAVGAVANTANVVSSVSNVVMVIRTAAIHVVVTPVNVAPENSAPPEAIRTASAPGGIALPAADSDRPLALPIPGPQPAAAPQAQRPIVAARGEGAAALVPGATAVVTLDHAPPPALPALTLPEPAWWIVQAEPAAPPLPTARVVERAEAGSPFLTPPLAAMMTGSSLATVTTLERGIRAFLEQMERQGPRWAGDEQGLSPWLVAVAAAATACEIARRQLRRRVEQQYAQAIVLPETPRRGGK